MSDFSSEFEEPEEDVFVPVKDMVQWTVFYLENREAMEEVGSYQQCLALARNCGLMLGGGAGVLFRVGFVD